MLWSAREWARVKASGDEFIQLVHDATNNEDKWGPTGAQMDAVCGAFSRGAVSIMDELTHRLKHRSDAWRPCYKSLLVLDYLARNVKETYLPRICALQGLLRTISTSFYYTNSKGEDHGISVRERAKALAELLSDAALLREEREKALVVKRKMAGGASDGSAAYRRNPGVNRNNFYNSPNTAHRRTYSNEFQYSGGPRGSPARPLPNRVPRTREEQEQFDLEVAIRLQREEERRSGVSAQQLEEMYARRVQNRKAAAQASRPSSTSANRPLTDEEWAARLQKEEEELARREGRSLPTLRSDKQPSSDAQPPSSTQPKAAPAPPDPPAPAAPGLDDLFAPTPAPIAPAAATDPFGAFNAPQQHADPFASQPQQSNPWGAPSVPQQSNAWGASAPAQPQQQSADPFGSAPPAQQPQQSNPWGAPSVPQQSNAWGASAPAQPQQQSADPFGSAPPAQQPQQSNPWGAPSAPADSSIGNLW